MTQILLLANLIITSLICYYAIYATKLLYSLSSLLNPQESKIEEPTDNATIDSAIKVDLDKNFDLSAKRVNFLKGNRHVDDIPITDEYWKSLKKHQAAHGGR